MHYILYTVINLWFIVAFIVCGMCVRCFLLLCSTVCPLNFCNHPAREERELVALFVLSSGCQVAVYVICLLLTVQWFEL